VNVISQRGLRQLVAKRPEAHDEAIAWYQAARRAIWSSLEDVRREFPGTDKVGAVLIFNLYHNRYRLIATPVYHLRKIYVKALLTHKEYDREEWKKWA
jgi:mRNA interferase HigB